MQRPSFSHETLQMYTNHMQYGLEKILKLLIMWLNILATDKIFDKICLPEKKKQFKHWFLLLKKPLDFLQFLQS